MEASGATHGMIFDIQRFCTHDGPGIRTVVFLKGCGMRCQWCCNPESQTQAVSIFFQEDICIGCKRCVKACRQNIAVGKQGVDEACCLCGGCVRACPSQALTAKGELISVDEVLKEVSRDEAFYSASGGGVTISGGEPLDQPEFVRALIGAFKARGYHVALETTGSAPWENAKDIFERADLLLYDVKHMDSGLHRQYTGIPNEQILENLQRCAERGLPVTLRLPLIKGVNTSEENITRLADMAVRLNISQINLLPYHTYADIKYKKLRRGFSFSGCAPERAELEEIQKLFELRGLSVSIGG